MQNEKYETIITGQEARQAMVNGVVKLAAAVKVTLGPCGHTAILSPSKIVDVTKDGVSVARAVSLPNRWENMAATLVRDVAINSERLAGDGTTTATVLAEAMVLKGIELLEQDGYRPNTVVRQLQHMVRHTTETLRGMAVKADTLDELIRVAEISANAEATDDYDLARLAAEAVYNTGKYGKVNLKIGHTDSDILTHNTGYIIDRGIHAALSGLVMNGDIRHQKTHLIVTQENINNTELLVKLIERYITITKNLDRPLIIMCGEVDDNVAGTINHIAAKIKIPVYLVRSPAAGNHQAALCGDIAEIAECTVFPVGAIANLDKVDDEVFAGYIGHVNDITLAAQQLIIGETPNMSNYVESLRELIPLTTEAYTANTIQERIARLTGGVATIMVGGHTETERKERMSRYDDATKAVRVAFNDGVVVGGGYALLTVLLNNTDNSVYRELGSVLTAPFKQILTNAWYDQSEIDHLIHLASNGVYFDILSDLECSIDVYKVVDPLTVTIAALENAMSIAKLVLQSSVMVGPNSNAVTYFG